jgi:hypothetical protein
VSDRRRQERWNARGSLELSPGVERGGGAAVGSTDFVSPDVSSVSHRMNGLE